MARDAERALDKGIGHCVELGLRQRMERRRARDLQPARSLVTIGELFLHVTRQRQCRLDRGLVDLVGKAIALAFRQHALGNGAVQVVAAQGRVAAGRQHLEHALLQPQHGEVEGAAAQIVDRVKSFGALVQTVGQRRRRRLVHQAQHFEAGNARGIAGRSACGIVEIGRDGDDGPFDRLLQRFFGALTQGLQNLGGNLDR